MTEDEIQRIANIVDNALKPIKQTLDEHSGKLDILTETVNEHSEKLNALVVEMADVHKLVGATWDRISAVQDKTQQQINEIKEHTGLS